MTVRVASISAVAILALLVSPAFAADDWTVVASEGFSVQMPEVPTVEEGPLMPGSVSARDYMLERPDLSFIVSAYLLSPNDEHKAALTFREAAERWLTEICRVETPPPLDLDAAVAIQCEGSFYRVQFYIEDERAYRVAVGGPRDGLNTPDAERFFSSFELPDVPVWQETVSEIAGFSAHFPGLPLIKLSDFNKHTYSDVVAYTVPLGRGMLRVSVMTFVPEIRAAVREEQLLYNLTGPVRDNCEESELTVMETEIGMGLKVAATCDGEAYRARYILVGDRLFVVSAVGTDGFATSEHALRFFDSFHPISVQ